LRHPIEGFNTSDLGFGTASASTVTLSFKVYSSLTGTFGGSLQNGAGNRSYPFSYSVSVANTWTTISITIAGDTSGTWIGATNAVGILVSFGLGMGSTYSTTAGAWAAGNYLSATSATSVVGTNGAIFYITGVQLEKGSTATSFDYRPYGTELALCQRYFYIVGGTSGERFGCGPAYSATGAVIIGGTHPMQMRTTPTLSLSAFSDWSISSGTAGYTVTSVNSTTGMSPRVWAAQLDASTGAFTANNPIFIVSLNTNSRLYMTSEL
jgi:hypothetical protein